MINRLIGGTLPHFEVGFRQVKVFHVVANVKLVQARDLCEGMWKGVKEGSGVWADGGWKGAEKLDYIIYC